mmetsp:Transcript_10541/g.25659  ORF Transcript_10541/g.25659 Transcript_10541/m.25659 type:complete len:338 (-) Transcript_10541:510-1523(-)
MRSNASSSGVRALSVSHTSALTFPRVQSAWAEADLREAFAVPFITESTKAVRGSSEKSPPLYANLSCFGSNPWAMPNAGSLPSGSVNSFIMYVSARGIKMEMRRPANFSARARNVSRSAACSSPRNTCMIGTPSFARPARLDQVYVSSGGTAWAARVAASFVAFSLSLTGREILRVPLTKSESDFTGAPCTLFSVITTRIVPRRNSAAFLATLYDLVCFGPARNDPLMTTTAAVSCFARNSTTSFSSIAWSVGSRFDCRYAIMSSLFILASMKTPPSPARKAHTPHGTSALQVTLYFPMAERSSRASTFAKINLSLAMTEAAAAKSSIWRVQCVHHG